MNYTKKAPPIRLGLILIELGILFPLLAYAEPGLRDSPLAAAWATREVPTAPLGLAVDAAGNAYIAGYELLNNFGRLYKYDDSGTPQWTLKADPDTSSWRFAYIAADAQGNAYAAGEFAGRGADFGNGVKLGPRPERQAGMLLVKYDSRGQAAWAQASFTRIPDKYEDGDSFRCVAIDAAGNVFAAGRKNVEGSNYPFLDKAMKTAEFSDRRGWILVKFDPSGRSMKSAMTDPQVEVSSIATDGADLYAAGFTFRQEKDPIDFGNGVRLMPPTGARCGFLAKYDSSLKALWAKSVSGGVRSSMGGDGNCEFNSLGVDSRGNAYAGGYVAGTKTHDFGNGVTATGTGSKYNPLLVKYDAAGTTLWARCVDPSSQGAFISNVCVGSMYAYASTFNGWRILGIDFSGDLQWELKMPAGDRYWPSRIWQISLDKRENIYVLGQGKSTGLTEFGNDADLNKVNVNYLAKYQNADFASKTWALANDSRVRVRSDSNLQASTLGYLDKGDLIEVLERSPERMKVESMEEYWYRISRPSDGLNGWSYGYFLKLLDKN